MFFAYQTQPWILFHLLPQVISTQPKLLEPHLRHFHLEAWGQRAVAQSYTPIPSWSMQLYLLFCSKMMWPSPPMHTCQCCIFYKSILSGLLSLFWWVRPSLVYFYHFKKKWAWESLHLRRFYILRKIWRWYFWETQRVY